MNDKLPLSPRHTEEVEVNGEKYLLTHPGMRMHNRWKKEVSEINVETKLTSFNMSKYLDLAFENCVEPIGHNFQPNQENLVHPRDQEVWALLLPQFLRGVDLSRFKAKKKEPKKAKASRE